MSDATCPACTADPPQPHTDAELKEFHPKAFLVIGADGVKIPIDAGDYYFNTKARGRRMWQNSLSSEARQVYAVLEMATMGFKQELAVKKHGGNLVPLTPGDVAQRTKFSKQNVRRAMEELKEQGLADRKPANGGHLRKGNVLLYSWAVPHTPEKVGDRPNSSQRATTIPDWFPEPKGPLASLVKQLKIKLPSDMGEARGYFLERLQEAARPYQESRKVVIEILKEASALAETAPIRERTERTSERTGDAAAASSPRAPEPPPPLDPAFDDVYRAMNPLCTLDDARVLEMIAACRVARPDATPQEMSHFIETKGTELRKRGNVRDMFKLIIDLVPPMLKGQSFLNYRTKERIAAEQEAAAAQHAAERERENEAREKLIKERMAAVDPEELKRLVDAEERQVRKEYPNMPTETRQDIAEQRVKARIADTEKAKGAS